MIIGSHLRTSRREKPMIMNSSEDITGALIGKLSTVVISSFPLTVNTGAASIATLA